ncbi:MAG: hypothetical protein EOO16_18015 [Chitinophagaceae bacterium]|nr:MAG: hypothetical protein EOO16_18015 [Chitinophagaceae bacterium]
MKKLLLFVSGLLALGALRAQPAKGRLLLGGSVNFNSSRVSSIGSNANPSNFAAEQLGLTFGFFPTNTMLVALNGSYSDMRNFYRIDNHVATIDKGYSAEISARRYYPLGHQFYLTFEGGFRYTHNTGSIESGANNLPLTAEGYTAGIGPGVSYSFGRRLLFDINLGQLITVSSNRQTVRDLAGAENARFTETKGGFGPGGSIPFNIGFNILLGK